MRLPIALEREPAVFQRDAHRAVTIGPCKHDVALGEAGPDVRVGMAKAVAIAYLKTATRG
jgi:hypothetical protein